MWHDIMTSESHPLFFHDDEDGIRLKEAAKDLKFFWGDTHKKWEEKNKLNKNTWKEHMQIYLSTYYYPTANQMVNDKCFEYVLMSERVSSLVIQS